MRITYISWAPHCSRSDQTARELGGTSHMVYWESLGTRVATIWLKYLGQTLRTWRVLVAERPDAAFVMTPPVFAALAAWLYCATHGCRLVLDAHTAAFSHRRWQHLQWLQAWLSRRAVTTIVHNPHIEELVRRRGGRTTLVQDIPVRFPTGDRYALPPGFNIAVVCSFNPDEPVGSLLEAAARRPDIAFHLTGNPNALDADVRQALPSNVRLTGFLSDAAYGSLLTHADAVVALTTRNHTMLRGAWEAIYQGTPVIVSDWPVLREAFDEGAIHVANTPDDIVRGLDELRQNIRTCREGARSLCRRKEQRWVAVREELWSSINQPGHRGRLSP